MRVLLCLLLFLLPAAGWAEWLRVIDVGDGEAVFYIDRATMQKSGRLIKVWEMQDLKQKTAEGVMSMRLLLEFDCAQRRSRVVFGTSHPGPMGEGRPLGTDNTPGDWSVSTPGTVSEAIQNAVCNG